eukprot:scaffold3450_cov114-Cylindrotheca_fusiformis.AAC.48
MEELEKALSVFLAKSENPKTGVRPRPPTVPPPLAALGISIDHNHRGELSPGNAKEALQKLRQRLKEEEQSLRKAKEALLRSYEEEKVLERAEMVLQRSRQAAEKRKAEAIRRTEAAMLSIDKARQSERDAEETATKLDKGLGTGARRSTVSIDSMINSKEDRRTFDDTGNKSQFGLNKTVGVPTLYNWTQDNYGSITGNVRGSEIFRDGETVTTSPVQMGTKGGVIVITTSGSRYYLQETLESAPPIPSPPQGSNKPAKIEAATLSTPPPLSAVAPKGIPSIRNWGLLECGGISGLLFNSPKANDGDYIETSPIAKGPVKNSSVVTTKSGSRYFLCSRKAMAKVPSKEHSEVPKPDQRGGTITINKVAEKRSKTSQQTGQKKPRPTFSLLNFGSIFLASKESSDKEAPSGVPTLTRWTVNDDGTITGVISGSTSIGDGDLVTTSPVIDGRKERFQAVTTATGSVYFLD